MPNNLMSVSAKGMKQVKRDLDGWSLKKDKALASAVKVELFRLMRTMKTGIRSAAPGGSSLEKLTALSRFRDGRFRGQLPFRGMSRGVKYDFNTTSQVGRVGWTPSTAPRLRWLAHRYQEGFETPVTDKQRRLFANRGGELSPRSRLRKFFFLKKDTTSLETPERQIVDPIYAAERAAIKHNIHKNFRAKMRGERI